MKRSFTLGALGALAMGAAMVAAPEKAAAQFLSVGVGGSSYGVGYGVSIGSGYGYGYSPYYGDVGYYGGPYYGRPYYARPYYGGYAPAYYPRRTRVVTTYPAYDYAEPVYVAPRRYVRQRVVTTAPRYYGNRYYGNRAYPIAAPHEVRGGYRTVIVSRNPVRRAAVDRYGRVVRYY
jgi:hypothetical protein